MSAARFIEESRHIAESMAALLEFAAQKLRAGDARVLTCSVESQDRPIFSESSFVGHHQTGLRTHVEVASGSFIIRVDADALGAAAAKDLLAAVRAPTVTQVGSAARRRGTR